MGLFNAAAAAASALGAITGGAVADRFGYESVSVFAAAGALLSLLCLLPLRNALAGKYTVKSSSELTAGN
jgi:predicted MFS family arabinose efflux permease